MQKNGGTLWTYVIWLDYIFDKNYPEGRKTDKDRPVRRWVDRK